MISFVQKSSNCMATLLSFSVEAVSSFRENLLRFLAARCITRCNQTAPCEHNARPKEKLAQQFSSLNQKLAKLDPAEHK